MKIILTSLLLITFCVAHAQTDTTKVVTTDSAVYFKSGNSSHVSGWNTSMVIVTCKKNLRYPDNAISYNIQGQVVTRFIVDSSGSAHDFIVVSGPEQLQDECVRVLKKVGIWFPAIQGGKKVNAWKTQPINFKLESR